MNITLHFYGCMGLTLYSDLIVCIHIHLPILLLSLYLIPLPPPSSPPLPSPDHAFRGSRQLIATIHGMKYPAVVSASYDTLSWSLFRFRDAIQTHTQGRPRQTLCSRRSIEVEEGRDERCRHPTCPRRSWLFKSTREPIDEIGRLQTWPLFQDRIHHRAQCYPAMENRHNRY